MTQKSYNKTALNGNFFGEKGNSKQYVARNFLTFNFLYALLHNY